MRLLSLRSKVATLEYESSLKDIPELTDWSPKRKRFDLIRHVKVETTLTKKQFRERLALYPEACIFNTISHYPGSLPASRITLDDGLPFIDNFGFYVYIWSRFSWTKKSDVDLRWNANQFPYNIMEPDLWFLLKPDT